MLLIANLTISRVLYWDSTTLQSNHDTSDNRQCPGSYACQWSRCHTGDPQPLVRGCDKYVFLSSSPEVLILVYFFHASAGSVRQQGPDD